jgi:uncharacterized protein (DUF885 family)
MTRSALLTALLVSIAAAAAAQPAQPPAPAAAPAQESESQRLHRLFRESDEASLRRNPLQGMFRGDYRYADRLGDWYTDQSLAEEKAAAEQDLATLETIDREALDATDRIAYDVFRYQRENDLRDLQPDLLALTTVRPVDHFTGFHTFYPSFASGDSAAPFRNVEDYENNLSRHRQFVEVFDRVIARFRQGIASGVVDTKLTIRNVIGQLDTQLAAPPEVAACATSCRTNICRTPATATASSICAAATCSTAASSSRIRPCR